MGEGLKRAFKAAKETRKPIHFARFVSQLGGISPWCAKVPRALVPASNNWTNRLEAVTCKACLKRHAESDPPE